MSVNIDIDLQSNNATGKIGAIAASLKGLEHVADDIDIDFDADIGDITDEITKFADALEGIDVDMDSLAGEMKQAAKQLDEAEISVVADSPSGKTGDGDSTGSDPPVKISSGFEQAARKASADGSGSDTLSDISRNKLLSNVFGESIEGVLSNEDLNWGRNGFAPWAKGRDIHLSDEAKNTPMRERAYGDFGLGLETVKNKQLRESELSSDELRKVMGTDFAAASDFSGDTFDSDFARNIKEARANALIEAFEGADAEPFGGTNTDLRRSELSGSEMYDVYSNSGLGHSPLNTQNDSRGDYLSRLKSTDFGQRLNSIESLDDAFKGLSNSKSRLGAKFRKFRPTMGKYMQLLAAIIPVAVGLGVQLLGVASAMGAVGAAGAAIMGLGLLGHGESMSGSFAQAKQQLQQLKREMFDMAQPAMQQFAPIQARMFDAIPEGLEGVFEEMEGLAQFEGLLFSLGGSLADGLERAVKIINDNDKAIRDLTKTFGQMLGGGLLDFFEFLIQSAYRNKQLIIDLGGALVTLAKVGYDVSMAVSRIVAALTPLFAGLKWISGLLNNRLILGMLTAITVGYLLSSIFISLTTTVWALGTSLAGLIGFLQFLGSGSVLSGIIMGFKLLISYVSVMIGQLTTLQLALYGVAAALAATGIGAIVVGAGMAAGSAIDSMGPSGGPGMGGGGGSQVYNDNRTFQINQSGDGDYASQKSMEDTVKRVGETNESQSLPPVGGGQETSDSGPN
jgi:hypothetical protein